MPLSKSNTSTKVNTSLISRVRLSEESLKYMREEFTIHDILYRIEAVIYILNHPLCVTKKYVHLECFLRCNNPLGKVGYLAC